MSALSVLFFTFVRIGLGAFGGGLATIPFIHHELVASHPWLTEREFAEVVSLAQMTPGPVAVNAATYVGYRLAGFAGSLAATFAVVAAPLALVAAAAWLLSRASGRTKRGVERVQRALRPAVAAMLFGAFWMVVRPLAGDWRLWPFTLVLLGMSRFSPFRKYPQLLLLAAGMTGMVLL
ncbi:chromate transporter [Aminivibrio sp.]|uniref:chromate transporter n=1 Tax=Aminivibrio sp. TaxID=1872489 RepID=UPI001A62EB2F|nr:chromate transporter [Aminivibrio sp.]MBL3539593.1 chromate transporter [Aminivibrio sp.]MDK2958478.1 chromate transporter [Synergistaceae bacterium]